MRAQRSAAQIAGLLVVLGTAWLAARRTTRPPPPRPAAVSAPAEARVPARTPAPDPTSAPPTAVAGPASTTGHSAVTLMWRLSPPPSPTVGPTQIPPSATPTPTAAECVAVRWTSSMQAAAPGQVLVEVTADNHCGRDLGPLDVWFDVAGWRQGSIVSSARGHPFERTRRGGKSVTVIGLPGSIDWMDRIDVRVVPAAELP